MTKTKATSEWRKTYYEKRINFYKNYLGGVCKHCGTIDNLEFDHIISSDKQFTITSKYDANWKILKPELDKCQLLCQSCHVIKSQNEGDTKPAAKHGTLGMHRHNGCRCDLCKEAKNKYMREYKRKARLSLNG